MSVSFLKLLKILSKHDARGKLPEKRLLDVYFEELTNSHLDLEHAGLVVFENTIYGHSKKTKLLQLQDKLRTLMPYSLFISVLYLLAVVAEERAEQPELSLPMSLMNISMADSINTSQNFLEKRQKLFRPLPALSSGTSFVN
jgi:hypothetical protein